MAATSSGVASRLRAGGPVSIFNPRELAYLSEARLGRLATIDRDGVPHVVPLGWQYNPALDTIDVGGREFHKTKKFKNAAANPKVALVLDDVLPPWRPRCVMVRGEAESLDAAADADGKPLGAIIRIHPTQVISWGLDAASADPPAGDRRNDEGSPPEQSTSREEHP